MRKNHGTSTFFQGDVQGNEGTHNEERPAGRMGPMSERDRTTASQLAYRFGIVSEYPTIRELIGSVSSTAFFIPLEFR